MVELPKNPEISIHEGFTPPHTGNCFPGFLVGFLDMFFKAHHKKKKKRKKKRDNYT